MAKKRTESRRSKVPKKRPAPSKHKASTRPLAALEVGRYGELSKRPLPAELTFAFIPTLASIVMRQEQLKGADLTAKEVIGIRDRSPTMVVTISSAKAVAKERGYADLDHAEPWKSWLKIKNQERV